MDLEALLSPRDSEAPSGENLEYDDVFVAMEIAARPGQERQAGSEILEAEDPDFADVMRKALAVMERSHDLRAGTTLAGAIIFREGLAGFAQATAYVRGCLERYWETCHPQLDADDDDDPTMRINSLQALGAPDPVLRALRTTPLTESRAFGRVTLRDILVAQGQMSLRDDESPAFDTASIDAAFRDTDPGKLTATLEAARAAQEDLVAIEQVFSERTPGQGPRLSEAVKLLRQIVQHVSAASGSQEGEAAAPEEDGAAEAPATAGGGAVRAAAPGQIASQADVIRTLDAVIGYYRRAEPSSPVPILLERAKRLVGADFMVIMKDMAPAGVDNVRLIGGLEYDE
jgi:type VI secretion system protein ImpA